MRNLSDRARALIDHLYKKPTVYRRLLGDSGWDLSALVELAKCNEPAAIPYIAPVLISGTKDEIRTAAEAIETLLSCTTPEDLISLDERVRNSWIFGCPYSENWYRLEPRELAKWVGPGEPGVLLLRLSSFHPNGFVREEAIRRVKLINDGSELTYLLIRLNDWVSEIRSLAQDAVLARVQVNYIDHFVKSLALVIRLENAKRADHAQVLRGITMLLSTPSARPAMIAGMNNTSKAIRRACFRIITNSNSDDLQDLLLAALRVDDPIIRLWSVRKISTVLLKEQLSDALLTLSLDHYAPIRLEALRVWVDFFPTQKDEKLRSALLDRSASVRDEARFHLRKQGGFDFAQFYRDAITVTRPKQLIVAISGLGETGVKTDADLVLPYISHQTAKVRQIAVKYLIRLGGERYVATVLDRIVDGSPSVSAQVGRELQAYVTTIGATRLWVLFEKNAAAHVRKNLLRLISALPKWESITCLIQAMSYEDNVNATVVKDYIRRWNLRYNRSQSAPSREQLMRLEAVLSQYGSLLDKSSFDSISFAVKAFCQQK